VPMVTTLRNRPSYVPAHSTPRRKPRTRPINRVQMPDQALTVVPAPRYGVNTHPLRPSPKLPLPQTQARLSRHYATG
jgi:hypothetical protein